MGIQLLLLQQKTQENDSVYLSLFIWVSTLKYNSAYNIAINESIKFLTRVIELVVVSEHSNT